MAEQGLAVVCVQPICLAAFVCLLIPNGVAYRLPIRWGKERNVSCFANR